MKHARSDYDGIQDAAGKIPDDEPVFILRGKDRLAPAAIMHWANLLEANGGAPDLVLCAKRHAMKMADYGREISKIPDAPAEVLR